MDDDKISQNSNARPIPEQLRLRRLERGLTIDKVRDDTKIPIKYITALEEGRHGAFPAKVYWRGFFLIYAKYLTMGDPLKLWKKLSVDTMESEKLAQTQNALESNYASKSHERQSLAGDTGIWSRFLLQATEGQNWILAFVIAPAILIGGFYGVYSYIQHYAYRSAPEKALDVPELIGIPLNSKGAPLGARQVQAAEFTIELSAKSEPTWMQVEMDDKLVFQGILPALQKKAFRFKNLAKIRVGNPKNTDIRINGLLWPLSAQELERTPLELKLTPRLIENTIGPAQR